MSNFGFQPRPPEVRERILEDRARAIETGEWMEKLGLHEQMGWAPPIGALFHRGESERDLRARAARSGLFLPGQTPEVLDSIITSKQLERQGVVMQAIPKTRYRISQGLDGAGTWDVPSVVTADFGGFNFAGATTGIVTLLGLQPAQNAPAIGSPDDIGPQLAVATATRVVGSGARHMATLLSAWVFARTLAGGAYAPANGGNMNVSLVSAAAAGAAQISSVLTTAIVLSGLTQFWTPFVLATVPAERQAAPYGIVLPQVCLMYFGDLLIASVAATAAFNVQGNSLDIVAEVV